MPGGMGNPETAFLKILMVTLPKRVIDRCDNPEDVALHYQ
jgi:hypothetical protein